MIVKNISGESRYFGFVQRGRTGPGVSGQTLANNATATLPDGDAAILATVQRYVAAGVMSIVQGPSDITLLGSVNLPAVGYVLGTGAVADADFVTVCGLKFVFANDPGTGVLGKYYAALSGYWAGDGAAQATALATLKTAINYNSAAIGVSAETVVSVGTAVFLPVRANSGVVATTGLTLVKSGANLAVSGATLKAGISGVSSKTVVASHVVLAAEVTATAVVIATALPSISRFIVQVIKAGAIKAWDGTVTVTGATIVLSVGTATLLEADDVITIFAQE